VKSSWSTETGPLTSSGIRMAPLGGVCARACALSRVMTALSLRVGVETENQYMYAIAHAQT
jgi:hypothetical protein